MYKFSYVSIFFIFFLSVNVFADSKIYLIRHATVQIENYGWSSSKKAAQYKLKYNNNPVEIFDPAVVLKKIDTPASIDTVFCSPQLRAVQTADLLFNNQVILNFDDNLMEFQYPVIKVPLIRMPVKAWLTTSLILWMAGNDRDSIPTYKKRKQSLEDYSDEITGYAERHGECIIVAHGIVIRELIKILKKNGWRFESREGYKNLAVNCLVK